MLYLLSVLCLLTLVLSVVEVAWEEMGDEIRGMLDGYFTTSVASARKSDIKRVALFRMRGN